MKKSLFLPGQGEGTRFVALLILSLILMFMDMRLPWMTTVRGYFATIIYPLQRVVDMPGQVISDTSSALQGRENLQQDNESLYTENQQLRRQLLKYEAVVAENKRLWTLLQSAPKTDRESIVGRLLAIDMTPYQQKVTIDRGSKHGIKLGTPFGDGNGMMGQITRVFYLHSEGLLISDPTHAIPVRLLRNDLRSVALGTGYTDRLDLLYYPVGRINSVDKSGEEIFATVSAAPLARLDKSTEVLLFLDEIELLDTTTGAATELVSDNLDELSNSDATSAADNASER